MRSPDFRLPRLGGGTVSLAAFNGKPVILAMVGIGLLAYDGDERAAKAELRTTIATLAAR